MAAAAGPPEAEVPLFPLTTAMRCEAARRFVHDEELDGIEQELRRDLGRMGATLAWDSFRRAVPPAFAPEAASAAAAAARLALPGGAEAEAAGGAAPPPGGAEKDEPASFGEESVEACEEQSALPHDERSRAATLQPLAEAERAVAAEGAGDAGERRGEEQASLGGIARTGAALGAPAGAAGGARRERCAPAAV